MPTLPNMYVIVRRDLNPVYAAVQGTHAVVAYSLGVGHDLYQSWNNGTLVFLGVRNEQALKLWAMKIADHGKIFSTWCEPDMGGQITAIACIDTGEIFKKLDIV